MKPVLPGGRIAADNFLPPFPSGHFLLACGVKASGLIFPFLNTNAIEASICESFYHPNKFCLFCLPSSVCKCSQVLLRSISLMKAVT